MKRFVDDDTGFVDWLARHPDGFVVNTYRVPRASYLRLHRATCPSLNGRPANGQRWTTDYVKFCGGREELEVWARAEVHGEVWACPRCTD